MATQAEQDALDRATNLEHLSLVPAGGELPTESPDTLSALESHLKEATQTDEDRAAEEKRLVDEAAAKASSTLTEDEKKQAEEKRLADEAAAAAPPDEFDKVELPPRMTVKAAESFATIKTLAKKAREDAAAREIALKAQLEELTKKVSTTVAPEVEKELSELRTFRQKFDIEADPKFVEFDAKVKANDEAVYAKLKANGVNEESIKKIQELGGPAQVDWESLSDKLPSSVRRYVESKVFENEDLTDKKRVAMEEAKKNSAEFLKTRQQELTGSAEARRKSVETELGTLLPKLEWFKELDPAKAKPEEKAAIDSHNELVKTVQGNVAEALADDSPQMKAILVTGFVQLQRLRAEHAHLKTTSEAELTKLKKELAESQGMLDRIKKTGTPRLRETPAPAPGTAPSSKAPANETTEEALARHYRDIQSAQA